MEIKIVGVAGGSGSGKTTFAKKLYQMLGEENCILLGQDSYYIDQSHRFDGDGGAVNFDHPESLDLKLLSEHLVHLKSGLSIQVPIYDFATHKRLGDVVHIHPKPIIIVDGILLFTQEYLVRCFDMRIFIEAHEDLRFSRRLNRDVKERGRTAEGVTSQFFKQVKPMHDLFVDPCKGCADLVVTPECFDSSLLETFAHLTLNR